MLIDITANHINLVWFTIMLQANRKGSKHMSDYSKQELEEAKTSLASTLGKCEKMQQSGKLQSSQKTLNDRRVNALRIALELIAQEMSDNVD